MAQSSRKRSVDRRGAQARVQSSLARAAFVAAEILEKRCLLSAGSTNLTVSQAAILAAVPSQMQGQFVGSDLELSAVSNAHVLTPDYIVLDQNPGLTAADSLAPYSSSSPYGLTPAQVRHAYGVDAIKFGSVTGDGSGQTIAIIDAYDDPTAASDLHAFDQQFGLPDPPSFTKVNENGGSTLPGTDPAGAGNDDWELEESLDIEWTHAIAPQANIILVEANSPEDSDLFTDAVGWARSAPGVSAISMSFGESEYDGQTSFDSLFTTPAGHTGVTFLASTGDGGSPGSYPAYSPNVVAVGGTSLNVDSSGNYLSETGWSGSGGGISQYETQPGYQKGVVTQSSTNRTIPDVAFDADPYTGVAVYDSYDYGSSTPWIQVGGTSLSSPSWAGLIAIADQGRVINGNTPLDGATQTLRLLYASAASSFNDITSGSNGAFSAGPGYDLVTGRGSPVAETLIPHLAAAGPYVTSYSPTGLQSSAPSYVDFNFSTAMDPTSFSVAADVDAFNGPGGVDLRASISGFSWLNGNTTLQVDFTPSSSQGPYTMTIGPQILSAGGIAMDQNQNGTNGETPADEFTGTFYYDVTPTQVAYSNPASGSTVTPPFTTLDLNFTAPINPATVSTSNLTLSEGTIGAATVLNSTTVQYTISGTLNGGTLTASMAQGALFDLNGNPVLAFTGSYILPAPAATGTPALLAVTDSGVSDSDDITNFDNSSPAKALQFSVPGTIAGDIVSIYSDGTLIGSATANSTTTTVVTNGTIALSSGVHSITARQTAAGVQSAASSPLAVTIMNTPLTLPAPGAFDPTFNGNGILTQSQFTGYGAQSVVVQPDGNIVVGGSMVPAGSGGTVATVVRYTPNGSLDSTFGTGGYVTLTSTGGDQIVRSIALQSDGKIVALITPPINLDAAPLEVARFNTNGTLDSTFGTGGIETVSPDGTSIIAGSLLIQSDGKILISGTYQSGPITAGELVRLNTNGTLDTAFNGTGYVVSNFGGSSYFTSAAVTSDGDIDVTGELSAGGDFNVMVARFTSSGAVDTTFGNSGYITTTVDSNFSNGEGIALQPNGKILVSAVLNDGVGLLRYSANGVLDSTFGSGGVATYLPGTWVSSPVVQPDGKILIDGQYFNENGYFYEGFIARFTSSGSPDSSFGNSGQVVTYIGSAGDEDVFNSLALQPDGRIVAVGVSSLPPSGDSDAIWTVVRLFGSTATLALDPSSDSGISNADEITNVTTPTFDVPNFAGLYTRVYDNGVLVSPSYSSGGTVTIGTQTPGVNHYTLTLVDAAGNESPATSPITVTIDTTPPTGTLSLNGALSAGLSSYSFTVTYTDNNAVAGSTLGSGNVLVTAPGGYSQLATLISATPSGNSGSITANYQITPATGGWGSTGTVYTFTLEPNSVTDVAGNAAASATLGTIAVSALNPPAEPQLLAATDSGTSSSDGITNFDNSSPAKALQFLVQGTVAGATVTIEADGVAIGSALANGTSTTVTTNGTAALSNGAHSITAIQALSGTQTGNSPALSITIDTVGPTAAITGPLVAAGADYDFTVNYTDATTTVNGVSLGSGNLLVTSAAGYNALASLVSQQANGSSIVATYQFAPPAGGWSVGSSTYAVSLQASQVGDIAGNFASAGSVGTLSLTASAAPSRPVLTAATDSGSSQSDDITNFNNSSPASALQFTVSSTVAGDTVTIYADGVQIGSAVATGTTTTVTTNGSTTLPDGVHSITARRAAIGQLASAPSITLGVTIDTVGQTPATPRLDPASDSGVSNSDGVTNVIGPTADVTVSEPGTVFLQVDGTGPTFSQQISTSGSVSIPLSTPSSFQIQPTLSTGQANRDIATGDFNGDGKQDIALGGTGVQMLFGNGDGTFQPAVTVPQAGSVYVYNMLSADFNGDGKPDLWIRTASGFEVLLNNGNGTFQSPIVVNTSVGYVAYAADINGDGKMDLVTQSPGSSNEIEVWLGNGNGTFQAPYTLNAGLTVTNFVVGDINGDGKPDIVAIYAYTTDTISAMINLGNNTFASPVISSLPNEGTNYLATADFNGDGKADLLTGNAENIDQVFLSNGNGTFTLSASITTGYNCDLAAAADVNGDGKADVLIAVNNVLYVAYGNGNGTFQTPATYSLSSTPYNVAFADFNGDGAPDIAAAHDLTTNNVTILLGEGGPLRAGAHTLTAWETDLAGNVSAQTATASITIDQTPPAASSFIGPVTTTPASSPHTFAVTFSDNVAVDAASLNSSDILVTGPNGYSQLATFLSATPASNGSPIVATYQVVAPTGGWTAAANGTYTANLQASQVDDTAGNYVPAGVLGAFTVAITAATAQPQLLAVSDTGVSSSDGVISLNNASPAAALQFSVGNTVAGATVTIYADGVAIGSAVATGATTTVVTSGALALSDGLHAITARQTSSGDAQSLDSSPFQLTVDTTPPTVEIAAVASGPVAPNSVNIIFSEPTYGLTLSNLQLTLNGVPVTLSSSQTLSTTDHVIWVLGNLASLTGTLGTYQLTVSPSSAVTDLAGNALAIGTSTSWINSLLTDPSFESPAVGTGNFNDYQLQPTGTGWTFAGYAGVAGNGSGYTQSNPNAPQGTQVAYLQQNNASMSQTVSLAAGSYTVSFYAAQRMWDSGQQVVEVLVDGNGVGTITPASSSYDQYSSNAFTVTAGAHTIEFLSVDPTGQDLTALIDNVQIASVASGQFADSGFETPSVGTGSFNDYAADPTGTAWTFTGYAGVAGNGSGYTQSNPNAPEGTQVAYLQQNNASISQSVSLSAGTYTVSFYAAQRMWDSGQQVIDVLVDGNLISTITPASASYNTYSTNAFTVSAGAHTIEFLSVDPGGYDYAALIDDVQIVSVASGQFADSGFEAPSVGTGNFNAYQLQPTGTAWTFSGYAGVAGNGSGYTQSNPNAPEGTQVAYLQQNNASMSQTVSLAAGTYTVDFQAAQRMWDSGQQIVEVLVDGNLVGTITPASASYNTYSTNSFNVSAGAHTFEFLSVDPGGNDYTALIDNVQIVSG